MSARVAAGILALLLFVVTAAGAQPPSPPGGISVGPAFFLTVTKSGTGTGTVTGPGINCGSDCLEAYSPNAAVTLTAAPLSGSTFTGWSGGGCSGTGSCSVSMTAAQSVVAAFSSTTPVASVSLSWTDTNNSPQESGTQVWFCQGNGCTPSIGFVAGTPTQNVTQFTHTPVPAGVLGYAVRAVGDPPLTPSAFSNTRYTVATGSDLATCALSTTIFCEDAETLTLPGRWVDGAQSTITVTSTPANVFSGTKAIQANFPAGGDGGWLGTFLTPSGNAGPSGTPGYDHLFARMYVKLSAGWQCQPSPSVSCGKLMVLYGSQSGISGPYAPYSGLGQAGIRPNGTDYYYAGIAMIKPTATDRQASLYQYYPEMAGSFGDEIVGSPTVQIPMDTWTCVEQELQVNTVGLHDGLQRLWVNDALVVEHTGMRWRDTTNLQTLMYQLSFNLAPSPQTQQMFVDNIVVATQRINCPTP